MATSQKEFLSIGDQILIYSDTDEGLLVAKTNEEGVNVAMVPKSPYAIFKIFPMLLYTAKSALKKNMKKDSPDILTAQLSAYEEIERNKNEDFCSQLEGKPIVYGQTIQLFQVKSSKWLTNKKREQENDTHASLERVGSKRAWFKVAPFAKSLRDGVKVSLGDRIVLVHVTTGCFLHQTEMIDSEGRYEVSISPVQTGWFFVLESSSGRGGSTFKNGDPFRFTYGTFGSLHATKDGRVICKKCSDKEVVISPKTAWILETAEPNSDLSHHLFSTPVRLRLLGTSQYLCIPTSASGQKNIPASLSSTPTFFHFVSASSDVGQAVHLQTETGLWIHVSQKNMQASGSSMIQKKCVRK